MTTLFTLFGDVRHRNEGLRVFYWLQLQNQRVNVENWRWISYKKKFYYLELFKFRRI